MPPKRSQRTKNKRSPSASTMSTTTNNNYSKTATTRAKGTAGAARENAVNEKNAMLINSTISNEQFDMHSISADIAEVNSGTDTSQKSPSQRFKPTQMSIRQAINAQHRKRSRSEKNANAQVTDALTTSQNPCRKQMSVTTVCAAINEVKREASQFTLSSEPSSLGANTLQILLAPKYNNNDKSNNKNNNSNMFSGSNTGNTSALKTDKNSVTAMTVEGTVQVQDTANVQVNTAFNTQAEIPTSTMTPAEGIIDIYRSSNGPAVALCGVLNLVIKAAGVTSVQLDAQALKDEANVNVILEQIYARLDSNNSNSNKITQVYALGNKDVKFKRFRRAFPDFFDQLIRFAFTSNVLLDDTFLPVLTQ